MKKNNEKIELTEKDFEFICPVNTKDMREVDKGYFCSQCEKKVYDVSDYTENEFDNLRIENSEICINFKKIVTTSLILTSTLCVASNTILEESLSMDENYSISKQENNLKPYSLLDLNQPIRLEHREVVEMGGGAVPIFIFEEEDVIVPIEVPPTKEDENTTNGKSCQRI